MLLYKFIELDIDFNWGQTKQKKLFINLVIEIAQDHEKRVCSVDDLQIKKWRKKQILVNSVLDHSSKTTLHQRKTHGCNEGLMHGCRPVSGTQSSWSARVSVLRTEIDPKSSHKLRRWSLRIVWSLVRQRSRTKRYKSIWLRWY